MIQKGFMRLFGWFLGKTTLVKSKDAFVLQEKRTVTKGKFQTDPAWQTFVTIPMNVVKDMPDVKYDKRRLRDFKKRGVLEPSQAEMIIMTPTKNLKPNIPNPEPRTISTSPTLTSH